MSRHPLASALVISVLCAVALAGCLTPQVTPWLSKAVVQARAGAAAKASACPADKLEAISPMVIGFGFDDAAIPEVGRRQIADAARWLACNPHVDTVITPDADHHGDAAHLNDLAQRRAQAVQAQLRAAGAAETVIHILARGAADPVTAPHLVIAAQGRGW